MRRAVSRFLEQAPAGAGVQIVNLGAGVDSLYFWLRSSTSLWRDDLVYFEVDFPEVLSKKLAAIKKARSLWPMLDVLDAEELMSPDICLSGMRELRTKHCRHVCTDMRISLELEDAVKAAGFQSDKPTIFLSECVLVYMQAMHGDNIIQWASSACSAPSAIAVYEQFNPGDAFGKVMVENLQHRGCPLLSIHDYPTLDTQRQRYTERGWETAWAADMNEIYSRHLDVKDVERIHKIEMMDEFEEWHLIQAHYFQLIAMKGAKDGGEWILQVKPSTLVTEGSAVPSGGYGGPTAAATGVSQPRTGVVGMK